MLSHWKHTPQQQCFNIIYWITNANRIIRLSEVLILICWMHSAHAYVCFILFFSHFLYTSTCISIPIECDSVSEFSMVRVGCATKVNHVLLRRFFLLLNLFVTFFICSFYVCTSCIHAISRDSHWYRNTHTHAHTGSMKYALGFSVFFLFILSFFWSEHILSPRLLRLPRLLSSSVELNDIYLSVFIYSSLHQLVSTSTKSNRLIWFVQCKEYEK